MARRSAPAVLEQARRAYCFCLPSNRQKPVRAPGQSTALLRRRRCLPPVGSGFFLRLIATSVIIDDHSSQFACLLEAAYWEAESILTLNQQGFPEPSLIVRQLWLRHPKFVPKVELRSGSVACNAMSSWSAVATLKRFCPARRLSKSAE